VNLILISSSGRRRHGTLSARLSPDLRPGLRWALAASAILLLSPAVSRADDVTDKISEAAAAYQRADLPAAIAALDAAAGQLRQKRADALISLLPLPPPGWTADPTETSSLNAEMLGGGTSATRIYHNGDQQVTVQITTDAPMLQGLAALVNGPLAASTGIKAVQVGGRSIAYTESDNGYMALIADKIIVKVDGGKQVPEPVLRSFVAIIDFDAIEKAAH
jgi:hypothetical protein